MKVTTIMDIVSALWPHYEQHGQNFFVLEKDDPLMTIEPSGYSWLQLAEKLALAEVMGGAVRITDDGVFAIGSVLPIRLENPFPPGTQVSVTVLSSDGVHTVMNGVVAFVRSNGKDGLWTDATLPFSVKIDDRLYPEITGVIGVGIGQIAEPKESRQMTMEEMSLIAEKRKRRKRK